MNDTLTPDSLKSANKVFGQHSEIIGASKLWMWLAIIELIVICYLLFIHKKRIPKQNSKTKFKNESLSDDIDFANIINSSFNSIQLYNEVKVKCHPDRFTTDENKNKIAESIFQEITKNKTNYNKLIELKEEAKRTLNINF